MLRIRTAQFRREILQAINGLQAVREGFGQIQAALSDAQNSGDLTNLIRSYNSIDSTFTTVVSNVEEIARGAREGRTTFRRIQFDVRRLIREKANVTFTPRNITGRNFTARNATRVVRNSTAIRQTVFGLIARIPANGQQELLRSIQTQTRQNFAEVRLLLNPVISMIRVMRNALPRVQPADRPRIMVGQPQFRERPAQGRPEFRNRLSRDEARTTRGAITRAVGEDDQFFEEFPAEAVSDEEAAFAEVELDLLEDELALDLETEISAAAFAEDDADSSDYAIVEESGSFDDVTEQPSFAIEESGDFAAIEEEAAAFALDENLESAAVVEDNVQFFGDDEVAAAVEDPAAAFSDNENYIIESAAVGDSDEVMAVVDDVVPGDVAVAEDTFTTFDDQLPGDLAVADELPTDLAVADELPTDLAVADEELPLDEQLPGDLAVTEEVDQFVDFPVIDRDLAVADELELENLALDEDDAAEAVAATPSTLTQPASTALPSWGIALIVIGVFVAIACILVVIQMFIYFRSA